MKYNLRFLLKDYPWDILSKLILMPSAEPVRKAEMEWRKDKTEPEIEAREVEIEVLINGIHVDPKTFFDDFLRSYEGHVKEEAQRIMKEKFYDGIGSKIREIEESLDNMHVQFKREFNIVDKES